MRRFTVPLVLALVTAGSAALAQQATQGGLAFDRWDTNHDNRITLSEVQTQRSRLFDSYDANGDGALSSAEMGRVSPQGAGGGNRTVKAQRQLRYRIDANGDGLVSRQEYVAGSEAWMQRMDTDGNGAITSTDFGRGGRGMGGGMGRWRN